ncbi:uncharacterized protein Z519_11023 [Cladophialophora bantiana CBS 173.52]|uniref:FAD-binding domain-containing protein n=1 Tax=Cladophialophora bantiana (strain ATCC 10958 / CBS 173.52 / CDC B-1940 / NIH 8579) TaxID=1442370 RepID=A0A0D2HVA4_CLAB1|nr:uncharacterized protein Z519_11023 [Cladophialophora bantiana CBS 173.52]KIW88454.1 hypothetical protein Z519_11023 [Cladophialophora bantiana CBS 173.52]
MATSSHTNGHTVPKFDVLIVGGGIAGLTTAIACRRKGFNVTVLEATQFYTHVGAGILLSGNAAQVLIDMGLQDEMEACSTHMRRVVFMTHEGKPMSIQHFPSCASAAEGGPLWQVHRADVHGILLKKAQEVGVTIRMGVLAKSYDWDVPAAVLGDGSVITADVIIAADGYRSRTRENLLGRKDEPRHHGYSAYRALIPGKILAQYPDLKDLVDPEQQTSHCWVGQGRHVLGYPIRGGQDYNMVYNQPTIRAIGSKYVADVDPADIQEEYKDWDPRLVALTKHLPKDGVLEWRLCDLHPLENWIFPGSKIVLIGDASHAMLPSAAQGAAMGIEDGAAIAELLARAGSKTDVPRILKTFQNLRRDRCIDVVENGSRDAHSWHDKDDPKYKPTSNWVWVYDIKTAAREIPLSNEA